MEREVRAACVSYLDGRALEALEGLFPFASLKTISRHSKQIEADAKPTGDRRGIRLLIPLENEEHLEVLLLADKALFQSVKDRSKGHITKLAKAAASVIGEHLGTLFHSPSPAGIVQHLGAALPAAIVARYLKTTFLLEFDVERFLASLFSISRRSYEGRAIAQGFVISPETTEEGADINSLLEDHSKQLLPVTDGYHTALEIDARGRARRLVDLEAQARRQECTPKQAGHYPAWLEAVALLTQRSKGRGTRKLRYVCAFVLTGHGDLLVLGFGQLLLSCRAGLWRAYDHRQFTRVIQSSLRSKGQQGSTLKQLAAAVYATALDVSFRHTGGLLGVLRKGIKLSAFAARADQLHEGASGLRGIMAVCEFHKLDRGLRAALAAIDGALIMDHEHKLRTIGAVVKGPVRTGRDVPLGARTRAAMRLSKGGLAVKISADGEVDLFEKGRRTLRLL